MENIQRDVRLLAELFLPDDHDLLFTETLLFSRAASETIQDLHCDFADRHSSTSLLAFVALEPETTLIVYPRTHRIDLSGNTMYLPRRILFNFGDVFLFHPRLLHCGDRYVESNLRLHYYVFDRPRFRWRNVTLQVRSGSLELMQIEENRARRQQNAQAGRRAAGGHRRALRAHFLIACDSVCEVISLDIRLDRT